MKTSEIYNLDMMVDIKQIKVVVYKKIEFTFSTVEDGESYMTVVAILYTQMPDDSIQLTGVTDGDGAVRVASRGSWGDLIKECVEACVGDEDKYAYLRLAMGKKIKDRLEQMGVMVEIGS